MQRYDRLHLGCGPRHLEGWANVDISGDAEIVWDLRKPLPVSRVRFVYTEHFIEHIERAEAVKLLASIRSILAPGGVLRLSTPDLAEVVRDYQTGNLPDMPEQAWQPHSICQMLNDSMRAWGHRYVYDEPELRVVLSEAGFSDLRRVAHGQSEEAELRALESRPDFGELIFEARV